MPTRTPRWLEEAAARLSLHRHASLWDSRLMHYRGAVLFTWEALTFHESVAIGAALWIVVNVALGALFRLNGSVLEIIGNILIILAISFFLLHLALKYANVKLFPNWGAEHNSRFHDICLCLAFLEVVTGSLSKDILAVRKTNALKFYISWLLIALLVAELGRWFSAALLIQLLACMLLLLPPALEYGWLADTRTRRVGPALKHLADKLLQLGGTLWANTQRAVEQWRQGRQRIVQRRNRNNTRR